MAKQKGLFPIVGKHGNQSFYYTRNGGYQVRGISETMSERVKFDPGFEMTRNYGKEFGAAGDTAAACVRILLDRWRYILTPKLSAELTSICLDAKNRDTSDPLGKRTIPLSEFPEFQAGVNRHSKNQLLAGIKAYIAQNVKWDASNEELVFEADFTYTDEMKAYLEANRYTGFWLTVYAMKVTKKHYDSVTNRWFEAQSQITSGGVAVANMNQSMSVGDAAWRQGKVSCSIVPQNSTLNIAGLLFIMEPYVNVNGVRNTMQRGCAAYWVSIPDEE